jgi:signal transduction histidine kinase
VDDLMDVSRITRGKIELRKKRLEIATVVQLAVEASRPLIEAARLRLELALPARPLSVEGDAVRLAQVLSNLLNNAAKFTPAGGEIRVRASSDGTNAVVSVRDTGEGIAPEFLPSVFEPFAQAEPSGTRDRSGLGIGLTLVQRLVDLHGGSVEARSEGCGLGSEFVVRLPLAAG